MLISVAILTWNNIDTLPKTLQILEYDLKNLRHEIIVVDNGSYDGTEGFAVISNRKNLGISIGKNQGIEAAQGEFVLLLDGDIIPVKNSVNCMLDWLSQRENDYAIGMYPTKFTHDIKGAEPSCIELWQPKIWTMATIYYGLYKRTLFDDYGVRCPTDGPFSGEGYGWEDYDFYKQMERYGIHQWVAGINSPGGKYYHRINSSIKLMGYDKYRRTSQERGKYFKEKWNIA